MFYYSDVWNQLNREQKFDRLILSTKSRDLHFLLAAIRDPIFNRIDMTIIAGVAIRLDDTDILKVVLHAEKHTPEDIEVWLLNAIEYRSRRCITDLRNVFSFQNGKRFK